jgi:hypothetical protein
MKYLLFFSSLLFSLKSYSQDANFKSVELPNDTVVAIKSINLKSWKGKLISDFIKNSKAKMFIKMKIIQGIYKIYSGVELVFPEGYYIRIEISKITCRCIDGLSTKMALKKILACRIHNLSLEKWAP